MKTFIQKNWKEAILFLWLVLTGMILTAQPTNLVTIAQKESIKSALKYLIIHPDKMYVNDEIKNWDGVGEQRYFNYNSPLTKEQWGEVMIYLFDKGFKREQIQMLTEHIIGLRCPTKCPGD